MNVNTTSNFSLPPGTIYGRIADVIPPRFLTERELAIWEGLTKAQEEMEKFETSRPPLPKIVHAEIVVNGEVVAEVLESNIVITYDLLNTIKTEGMPGDGKNLAQRRAEYIADVLGGEIRYPAKQLGDQGALQAEYPAWTDTYWGKELLARSNEWQDVLRTWTEKTDMETEAP